MGDELEFHNLCERMQATDEMKAAVKELIRQRDRALKSFRLIKKWTDPAKTGYTASDRLHQIRRIVNDAAAREEGGK